MALNTFGRFTSVEIPLEVISPPMALCVTRAYHWTMWVGRWRQTLLVVARRSKITLRRYTSIKKNFRKDPRTLSEECLVQNFFGRMKSFRKYLEKEHVVHKPSGRTKSFRENFRKKTSSKKTLSEGLSSSQSCFLNGTAKLLYKGFLPKVLRLGPGGGILLVVFTGVMDFFKELRKEK